MANVVDGIKYTKEHEWIKVEGDNAISGITDYAQSELSDIVMVEPPKVGRKIRAGDAVGTIEAVKAVSELFSPVTGTVTDVNSMIEGDAGVINRDPYGEGWMIKAKLSNPSELDHLLKPNEYKQLVAE